MRKRPKGIRSIMRRRGYMTVADVAKRIGRNEHAVQRLIGDAENYGFGLRAWQVPPSPQFYIKPAALEWLIQRRPELAGKKQYHEHE